MNRACMFTAVTSLASHLLCSPLVAQRPELVWVGGTDLMQRSQVPRQVCPKVLCGFREVGDILQTQWKFWTLWTRPRKMYASGHIGICLDTSVNPVKNDQSLVQSKECSTHSQLIQKHDHPMFVVFDERVHTLHIGLLLRIERSICWVCLI